MASGQDIDKQDGIDTSNFYFELGTAQVSYPKPKYLEMNCLTIIIFPLLIIYSLIFKCYQFGAWASMACWVGLSIFALLKMFQQHEIQNMRASMLRERQHLINEAGLDKRNKPPHPEKSNSPQKF